MMITKTARIGFGKDGQKITCTSTGIKDACGKAYWKDGHGNYFELSYARHAKRYAFLPCKAPDARTTHQVKESEGGKE